MAEGLAKKVKPIFMTLGSQAGWSGANFLVTMIMARQLDPAAFGIFGLYLVCKRGGVLIASALLLVPLTVISAQHDEQQRTLFANKLINSLYFALILFMGCSSLLIIVMGINLISVVVFVSGAMLLETARRYTYIENKIKNDLAGALLNFSAAFTLLYLLILFDSLSASSAALSIGAVYIAGAVIMLPKPNIRAGLLNKNDMKEIWNVGGWGLATNTTTYLYSEANTFYTLLLIGPTGVAVLELAKQFVAVLQPILYGMANFFHPKIAISAKTDNTIAFSRKLAVRTAAQILIGMVAIGIMLILAPYVLGFIVGNRANEYESVMPIAAILGASALLRIGWQEPAFAMTALGRPVYAFISRVIGAIIAIAAGYVLISEFGLMGAAWTKLLGDTLIVLVSTYMLVKLLRTRRNEQGS